MKRSSPQARKGKENKEKVREKKGQRENACIFLITGAKGRLMILSSCGCLQANTHALIYLFIYFSFGKLRSQHSLMNYLCHSKSVCACFCNYDVFLCLSLVVHHSGLVIVAI